MSTSLYPALAVTHSQTLTGLLPETAYHNQAKPRDEGGSGAQSAGRTFTTPSEVLMSTLTPTGGTTGTQVVINGRGFGTAQSAGAVTFSGVPASVGVVHPGVSFDRCNQWLPRGHRQQDAERCPSKSMESSCLPAR